MAPFDSLGLKYWSCPHNLDVCGAKPFYVASRDVIKQSLQPTGAIATNFTDGAACHYRIVFPQGAGEFDQILITLTDKTKTKVYLTETETFRSMKFEENVVSSTVTYAVTWPNEAFIVATASEGE